MLRNVLMITSRFQVINAYMTLIAARGGKNGLPRVHSMSTFFYVALTNSGYNGLANWTKNVDLFTYDIILIPIHLPSHWTLIVNFFNLVFTITSLTFTCR